MSRLKPFDLIGALAPRQAVSDQYADVDDEIGAIAFTAIASLLAKGARAAGFMQSGKGRKLLGKLQESEKQAESRYKLYQAKYERAENKGAKKRWKRRMDRAKARWGTMRIQNKLSQQGITGEGPVLEFRRNLLSQEWDGALSERKAEIEGQVAKMDARLQKLKREADLLQSYKGSASRTVSTAPVTAHIAPVTGRLLASPPRWRKQRDLRGLISGHGGIDFQVQAPPGPAREVRIPFYPESNAQEYHNAPGTGIDQAGDNPVTNLQIPVGEIVSGFVPMVTRALEYGTYRIIGIQTNAIVSSHVSENVTALGVGLTVRNLRIYNGQKLFLTAEEGELDALTFSIFPSGSWYDIGIGGLAGSAYPFELPSTYARRKSRQFSGLRDNAIVSDNAVVRLDAFAFTTAGFAASAQPMNVPFTCNLVAEIIEDKVYGNIVNPSPAARSGATVKVGMREMGMDSDGRDRAHVVSVYRRPR